MLITVDAFHSELQAALGDTYTIEHELGGGRHADRWIGTRTFLAREPAAGRRVVLTVLPDALASRIDIECFRREIELAAALRHPQIVALLAAGVSGRFAYYTMPFLEGESLRKWIDASGGRLPIREAVRIGAEVAGALQAAHEQGIVHRDVRPATIVLVNGHAVVTNAGAARAVSRSLSSHDTARRTPNDARALDASAYPLWLVGTPAYMSPEQATGTTIIDGRSDIYSLGCVLYEMLTGARPFSGTQESMLRARQTVIPERPSRWRKDLPGALDRVVMKALAIEAEARYPTARELQRALLAVLARRAVWPITVGALTALRRAIGQGRSGERAPLDGGPTGDRHRDATVGGVQDSCNVMCGTDLRGRVSAARG